MNSASSLATGIDMNTRIETLQDLIDYRGNLSTIINDLKAFDWDSDRELIELTCAHISSVLQRYLKSEFTLSNVENWANIIEGREDIGYEKKHNKLIRSTLHQLANPLLTQLLTADNAQMLIHKLSN